MKSWSWQLLLLIGLTWPNILKGQEERPRYNFSNWISEDRVKQIEQQILSEENQKAMKEVVESDEKGILSLPQRYLRRLGNAYQCLREFVGDLYQAKYRRDERIFAEIEDNQNSLESERAAHASHNEQALTITQKFYVCLDREPVTQTESQSK